MLCASSVITCQAQNNGKITNANNSSIDTKNLGNLLTIELSICIEKEREMIIHIQY